MNIKAITLLTLTLGCASFDSAAAMGPYMKDALVNICKAVKTDKMLRYTSTVKYYRLNDKIIAENLMCNGDNVITFAEKHQAYKIAARLNRSLGQVEITDIVARNSWSAEY